MQGSVCSAVSHTAARPHWPAGGTGACRISLRQQVSRYSQQRLPPRGTCDLRPSDRWRSTGGVRTTVRTEPAATARPYGVTRLAAGAALAFQWPCRPAGARRPSPALTTRPARQVQGQIAYDDWTMINRTVAGDRRRDRQLAMGGSGVGVGAAPRAPLPRAQPPTETHDYETTFLIMTIVVHSRERN